MYQTRLAVVVPIFSSGSYLDVLLHLAYVVLHRVVGLLQGRRAVGHPGQGVAVELLLLRQLVVNAHLGKQRQEAQKLFDKID